MKLKLKQRVKKPLGRSFRGPGYWRLNVRRVITSLKNSPNRVKVFLIIYIRDPILRA